MRRGRRCNATSSRCRNRSCQIIAEQAGHAVAAEQPEVVVNAIRAVVDAIRKQGRIGPQCGSRVEGD